MLCGKGGVKIYPYTSLLKEGAHKDPCTSGAQINRNWTSKVEVEDNVRTNIGVAYALSGGGQGGCCTRSRIQPDMSTVRYAYLICGNTSCR